MRKTAKRKTARKVVRRPARKGTKAWTASEVKMLRQMYKSMSTTVIAKKLRRTLSSVRSKVVALSLKKGTRRRTAGVKMAKTRGRCCK